MLVSLDGFLWLLVLLGPLLFLQRRLHREIQSCFLLLTRRAELSIALFSLLFLPGVLLHELSHFLMARMLGVATGRFSLLPQPMPNGRLQLGYVETARTDIFRDALIGASPLLAGGIFVALVGVYRMGLGALWEALLSGDGQVFRMATAAILEKSDFWVWFYLTFTVSSTMLPSTSDRRAWLPLGLIVVVLLSLVLLAGAGLWLISNLAPALNTALRALAGVLGISVLVHLVLLPPIWMARRLLNKLTGLQTV